MREDYRDDSASKKKLLRIRIYIKIEFICAALSEELKGEKA